MGTTPTVALPYPELTDTPDVPRDVKALADKLDTILATLDPFAGVPVGAIAMWATAAAPTHWLLCDGTQVEGATWPELAAVLGTVSGKVTLPNLQARVPIGAGAGKALGAAGGDETVTLTGAQIPAHTHPDNINYGSAVTVPDGGYVFPVNGAVAGVLAALTAGTANLPYSNLGVPWTGHTGAHGHAKSGGVQNNTGGGGSHPNLPPFLVVNYIIRGE